MKTSKLASLVIASFVCLAQAFAQTPHASIAASAPSAVPPLIPYSGQAGIEAGKAAPASAGITFLIFKDEEGGEPLWTETQTVNLDASGHYQAEMGATGPNGLPLDLFSTGEARWLEVQTAGERPQPRVLLASVPYALKAGDAATLGGLPVSAFALAGAAPVAPAGSTPEIVSNGSVVTTPGGLTGYLAKFTGATSIADSPVFIKGTNVGIGTINPAAALEVTGQTAFQGKTSLLATGAATSAAGAKSEPLDFVASAYSTLSGGGPIAPNFVWQAEPVGNNTSFPTASLNLLAGFGDSLAESGFYFNFDGTVHFSPRQKFPGTISGVTAGTGLLGGGTSGPVTLKLDTAKVPLLDTDNTFTAAQYFGAVTAKAISATVVNANSYSLGGAVFAFGSAARGSAYLGYAGNQASTGAYNTAVGDLALGKNTTGSSNTAAGAGALGSDTTGAQNMANGASALPANTTGSYNTADGVYALKSNTIGSYNTALGYNAGPGSSTFALTNSTAIGANSVVSQSNSLILGQTALNSPGSEFVNVGIGTATPRSVLEAATRASGAVGPILTLTNTSATDVKGSAAAIDFNTALPSNTGVYNPTARIAASDDGYGGANLYFLSNPGNKAPNSGLQTNMVINSIGQVGINFDTAQSDDEPTLKTMLIVGGRAGQPAIEAAGGGNSVGYFQDGILGYGGSALHGTSAAGTGGVFQGGTGDKAPGGDGIIAQGTANSSVDGLAGNFLGDVSITGTLNAGMKNFKIDHPLDPANKYLVHTSVESSEMVNIYSGNAVTDDLGVAIVQLPDWFEAENGDFRYQLTVVGRKAQAWISEEVANHRFIISSDATGVKVSWQIAAVRQDVYAKAHPLVVEQEKTVRGLYLHPELYGQPEEKQIEWGRHPETMRHLKAHRDEAVQKLNRLASVKP